MKYWPTKKQWQSWSLPSKLTAIGVLIGIISLLLFFGDKAFDFFKPTVQIENVDSPNSVNIIGNDNTVNKLDLPSPVLNMKQLSFCELDGESYKTEILLSIEATAPYPSILLQAEASSIIEMQTFSRSKNINMTGHSGKREWGVFTHLIDAIGEYKIKISTSKKEDIAIMVCTDKEENDCLGWYCSEIACKRANVTFDEINQ